MESPPTQKSLLSLGVTGHRYLVEIDRLENGVDQALEHLQLTFPGSNWQILSSLAEGADRLVAHRAMTLLGARLVAVLPLTVEEYHTTFASDAASAEFQELLAQATRVVTMPPAKSHVSAYRNAGLYLLNQCDALITLWDGKAARTPGGTGEIVSLARQRGLPLAWIHCGNRTPGTSNPTTLGQDQGKVTLERIPLPTE